MLCWKPPDHQEVFFNYSYTKFVFNFQFEKSLIKYVFKLKKIIIIIIIIVIIIIIIIIIIISSSIIISQYKTLESTLRSMRTRRRGSMRKKYRDRTGNVHSPSLVFRPQVEWRMSVLSTIADLRS